MRKHKDNYWQQPGVPKERTEGRQVDYQWQENTESVAIPTMQVVNSY